ncbi:MAG: spore maturation protein A [Oscillospiraceae bacterium]|nr:spore maturation protein A [Oscillospiraceae bacterium]
MAMDAVWTILTVTAVIWGAAAGRMGAVSAAALEGAAAGVQLCLSLAGAVCLWSGVMELLRRCGLAEKLAMVLRPVLGRLLPKASADPDTLAALSGNVSANLLGLGNAATPLGMEAACAMAVGCGGRASDELVRLVVLNTASIQLLPTTAAALRAALGSAAPLDILPCVWVSSALSVAAGLLAARLLEGVWR